MDPRGPFIPFENRYNGYGAYVRDEVTPIPRGPGPTCPRVGLTYEAPRSSSTLVRRRDGKVSPNILARRHTRIPRSFRGRKGTTESSRTRMTDRRDVRVTGETRTSSQPRFGSVTVSDRPTYVGVRDGGTRPHTEPPTSPWSNHPVSQRTATGRLRGTVFVGPTVPVVVLCLTEDPPSPGQGSLRVEVRLSRPDHQRV